MLPYVIWSYVPVAPVSGEGGEGSAVSLVLYILLALSVSFICSMCEAALFSTTHAFIEVLVQRRSRVGLLLRNHKANVDRPIAAILTLNTIAHTAGAAGAGAEAALLLGNDLVGIITVVLTLLILIFSEIIPKTMGALYWQPLSPLVAYLIEGMIILTYPAVWAFERLTRLMTPKERAPTVTRSELEVLAALSTSEGGLEKSEHIIFRNLLHLGGVHVSDIMTPRTVMLALHEEMTVGDVLKKHRVLPYSRIPTFSESFDDIRHFVLRSDVLMEAAQDHDHVAMKDLARPLDSVPENMTVDTVLAEFTNRQEHIFLVFDEYGGVADLRELAQQRYQRQQRLLGILSETDEQTETTDSVAD